MLRQQYSIESYYPIEYSYIKQFLNELENSDINDKFNAYKERFDFFEAKQPLFYTGRGLSFFHYHSNEQLDFDTAGQFGFKSANDLKKHFKKFENPRNIGDYDSIVTFFEFIVRFELTPETVLMNGFGFSGKKNFMDSRTYRKLKTYISDDYVKMYFPLLTQYAEYAIGSRFMNLDDRTLPQATELTLENSNGFISREV